MDLDWVRKESPGRDFGIMVKRGQVSVKDSSAISVIGKAQVAL
jgi:hypothetical protein